MKLRSLILCLALSFLFACGGSSPSQETPKAVETETDTDKNTPVTTSTAESKDDSSLYAWVTNLNIRSTASTSGKVVATVQPQDALVLLEQSTTKEEFVLRGVLYNEPWMKVQAPDGKEGWVFGGAVKHADEEKGNAPFTDDEFSFPYFGQYDLSEWKKINQEQGNDEGDFDTERRMYQRSGQTLTIETYDGEYGYGYTYLLKANDGEIIKEREFRFSNDLREMEETVKDYNANPPQEYSRKQTCGKSSFQLNAKPLLAAGSWTKNALAVE